MCIQRGHSDSYLTDTAVWKNDKFVRVPWCSVIMGNTGLESIKFKAIHCGDYPKDSDLPKGMVSIH